MWVGAAARIPRHTRPLSSRLAQVVLLNLLITIMAEARERAREEAHLVAKYRRAKLVVDHESMVLDDMTRPASRTPQFWRPAISAN